MTSRALSRNPKFMTLQKGVGLGNGVSSQKNDEIDAKLNALQNEIFALKEISSSFVNEMRDELIKRGNLMKEMDSYLCDVRAEAKQTLSDISKRQEAEDERTKTFEEKLIKEHVHAISEIKSDTKGIILSCVEELKEKVAEVATSFNLEKKKVSDEIERVAVTFSEIEERNSHLKNAILEKFGEKEKIIDENIFEMRKIIFDTIQKMKTEEEDEARIRNETFVENEETLNKIRNEIGAMIHVLRAEGEAMKKSKDEMFLTLKTMRDEVDSLLSDVSIFKGEKGDNGLDGKDGVCVCKPPSVVRFDFETILHCSSGKWECPTPPSFTISRVENLCHLYLGAIYVFRKGGSCSSFKFEDKDGTGISPILIPANQIVQPCFIQTKRGMKVVCSVTIETNGNFYIEGIDGWVFNEDFSILPINLSWSLI